MPAPRLVPVLSYDSYDKNLPISNISIILDATCLRCWRDTSEYGTSDPNYPYYAMDLKIHSFRSSDNIMLARYTGGKLKKDALYQLRGRYLIDTSKEGSQSYLHIDEAIRFQGPAPGMLKSFRKPSFLLVGEPVQVYDKQVALRWVTRDDYRRNTVYEQSAVFGLETPVKKEDLCVGRMYCLEGRMDGLDPRRDWITSGVKLC